MNGPSQDYDRVELVWPGKRTEVERVRLPFQVIERVNDVPHRARLRLRQLSRSTVFLDT